jgi:hypothetical protein
MTSLAFRTPIGGVAIPAGISQNLGRVDVGRFAKVRVVIGEKTNVPSGVKVRLAFTEGREVLFDLDSLELKDCSQLTMTYEVPGSILTVLADTCERVGTDGLDVLIYGSE